MDRWRKEQSRRYKGKKYRAARNSGGWVLLERERLSQVKLPQIDACRRKNVLGKRKSPPRLSSVGPPIRAAKGGELAMIRSNAMQSSSSSSSISLSGFNFRKVGLWRSNSATKKKLSAEERNVAHRASSGIVNDSSSRRKTGTSAYVMKNLA